MFIRSLLLIAIFSLAMNQLISQSIGSSVDISSIDPDQLTDDQIGQIVDRVNNSGMSLEEAYTLARARGASEFQIASFRNRINSYLSLGSSFSDGTVASEYIPSDTPPNQDKNWLALFAKEENYPEVYGMSLFRNQVLTFEPNLNIPTPENYVLGVGDEIIIDIWGASQASFRQQISKSGTINLGNLGYLSLNGYSLVEAKKVIKNRLKESYVGLAQANPNTYCNIGLGQLRSITVNVIGEAKVPGSYTISSMATAFNVLYLAGGPNQNGSLRTISIIRNGRVHEELDIYKFLTNDSGLDNIQLRDMDIIRVNTYDARVKLSGEVRRPMRYEIIEGENLTDVLTQSGGFSEDAFTEEVNVYRKSSKQLEIKTVKKKDFNTFPLQDGDEIEVGAIMEKFSNRVSIKGAIYRPGNYELKPDMTLSELIEQAGGLQKMAYLDKGVIKRLREDYLLEAISFDLKNVLVGSENVLLNPEDNVTIFSKDAMQEEETVQISGEVLNPGAYEYLEGLKLDELILMAGGVKDGASLDKIEISRRNRDVNALEKISDILLVNLDSNLVVDGKDQFELKPFDIVFVRKNPAYEFQSTVSVQGEVFYPGVYAITDKNEYLSDLIKRAGGITEYGFLHGASLRRNYKDGESYVAVDLSKTLKNPHSVDDILLVPDDQIIIPKTAQTVTLKGSVYNPISIRYEKRLTLKAYIDLAGGFSEGAKKGRSYVKYPDNTSHKIKRILGVFKSYPKVEPGSVIVVPSKEEKDTEFTLQRYLAITTSLATLALVINQIAN